MKLNKEEKQNIHCSVHYIKKNEVNYDEELNNDADFVYIRKHPELDPHRKDFDQALNILKEKKVDLKWGDLVVFESCAGDDGIYYRNDGVSIFNGEQIVSLQFESPDSDSDDECGSSWDEYGSLPLEFQILTPNKYFPDGVPVNYWLCPADHFTSPRSIHGISHNSLVNFDCSKYKDELVKNILHDENLYQEKKALYTSFTHLDKKIYLVYDYQEYDEFFIPKNERMTSQMEIRLIKKFTKIVKQLKLRSFSLDLQGSYHIKDLLIKDSTVLFV